MLPILNLFRTTFVFLKSMDNGNHFTLQDSVQISYFIYFLSSVVVCIKRQSGKWPSVIIGWRLLHYECMLQTQEYFIWMNDWQDLPRLLYVPIGQKDGEAKALIIRFEIKAQLICGSSRGYM